MEIKTLSATFGRLENETLTLSPGLNVIEAGNESGKTTWMTFVRVMLYGLNTRDRSPLADKHRYMPWSGSAMQGQMELESGGSSITVTRSTARVNAPMGAFNACFTGTTTPVPDLTAASLGESVLGVPQDVFERSAFIRQSGIPIDQSASLERRIAALITTGEEDSSFTDASERLRKQLTRRRYNKTGLLPQLESEITGLEGVLSEITALEADTLARESEQDKLLEQETYLRHQLKLLDAADNAKHIAKFEEAQRELKSADDAFNTVSAQIALLPPREDLTVLMGVFAAAETLTDSIHSAKIRADEAAAASEQAQRALDANPLSPQTPEEAANSPITDILPPRSSLPAFILSVVGSAILFLLLYCVLHLPLLPAAVCSVLTVAAACGITAISSARRKHLYAEEIALKRAARDAAVDAYTIIYREAEAKSTAARAAADAHRTLVTDYQLHTDRILNRVRRFRRAADLNEARRAVEDALARYAAFDAAEQAKKQAQLRFDLLAEHPPVMSEVPAEAPALFRHEAEQALNEIAGRLSELRRLIHTAKGRCQALGDPLLLQADLAQKQAQHEAMQKEYDALALACSVLAEANTTLQNRFSPALGEKAANIFTKLTRGKYNKVLLDRKMTPSAQEDGSFLPHGVLTLSQGAADQLYLAVRLAICDMVLPEDKCVPIFLDDALVTFDDARMAAALDYLVELAERRQILLFTCQQRELAYLRAAHPGRYHAVELSPSAE